MIQSETTCPRLYLRMNELRMSESWRGRLSRAGYLMKSAELLGISQNRLFTDGYYYLMDIFRARLCHGMTLPCSRDDPSTCVDFETARHIIQSADTECAVVFNDDTVIRLGIGTFLAELRTVLVDVTMNTTSANFFIFSAHDITLAPILGALKLRTASAASNILYTNKLKWPAYASSLAIELWQDKRTSLHYVRVFYNSNSNEELEFDMKGCSDGSLFCFSKFLSNWIPDDLEKECADLDFLHKVTHAS